MVRLQQPGVTQRTAAHLKALLRGRSRASTILRVALLVLVLLSCSSASLAATFSITRGLAIRSSLTAAEGHLRIAESLVSELRKSPLDTQKLAQLRTEVGASEADFLQAHDQLAAFKSVAPHAGFGTQMNDAEALVGMGIDLTAAAGTLLDTLEPIVGVLRSPLVSSSGAASRTAPALSMAQLTAAQHAAQSAALSIQHAVALRKLVTDRGSSLGSQAVSGLALYDRLAPQLQQGVAQLQVVLHAAPALLGVQAPATYLLELLDTTEIRGGGGFIGNYGLITVAGGHLAQVSVRDTYLLDDPYLLTHERPFPPEFSWFDLAPTMGLRDSNLAPNFGYDAQLAAQILREEGGPSVQGVVAITPAFMAQVLAITGPVKVPGYNATVTSKNLIATIHYYQFQTTDQGVVSPDGVSSTRKHFTAVLGQTVFGRLKQLDSTSIQRVFALLPQELQTKDVQIVVFDKSVQGLLAQAVAHPAQSGGAAGDSFELVDNNIGANKAFLYVSEAVSGEVSVGMDGSSQHTLTVQYQYHPQGDIYGPRALADEVQIYAPGAAHFSSVSGLDAQDPEKTFNGQRVWGGQITIAPGDSRTVIFRWSVPGSVQHAHCYALLVVRQAASIYTLSLRIHLPPSLTVISVGPTGVRLSEGTATYASSGAFARDLPLAITWK